MKARHARDKVIDGFRGVAVLGVVFGHAVAYRFGSEIQSHDQLRPLGRLAGPFSEMGVKLFFVISGYIITTLLLKEEEKTGGANIPAFYSRRALRILPPFFFYLSTLLVLQTSGAIVLPVSHVGVSAAFLCNTSIIIADCDWFVAHTWSLAVEEQFYLFWPLMMAFIRPSWRKTFLIALTLILLAMFLVLPFQYHSNFSSFPCITVGVFCAVHQPLREIIGRKASGPVWSIVAGALMAGYMSPAMKLFEAATPFALVYLIFSAYKIKWIRILLESWPLQMLGLGSYSLYLWQQVFLADAERYLLSPPPLWLLPVVVVASVVLIEKPFIRVGRKASSFLNAAGVKPEKGNG